MARANRDNAELIYQAATRFVEVALKSSDSLFTPGQPIWSLNVCKDLYARFTERPDTSSDTFEDKFKRQLAGAPPQTIQLAAELIFVHFLASKTVTADTKRSIIEQVLSWSPQPVAIPDSLLPALNDGLAHPGMAFNTKRPFLLSFLLRFVIRWKELLPEEQNRLLADPWAFKTLVFSLPASAAATQQNALLNLVHPEAFEPITSEKMKLAIAAGFKDLAEGPSDLDRKLFQVREKLAPQYGPTFNFYDSPLRERWDLEGQQEQSDGVENPISATAGVGNSWLFQANPEFFDVEAALNELEEITWEVNQSGRQIKQGDQVFLWVTGRSGGLKALARILNNPEKMTEPEAHRKFWRIPGRAEQPKLRVMMRLLKVMPTPIPRAVVTSRSGLADLPNLRFANATNYGLTAMQASALLALLDGREDAAVSPNDSVSKGASDPPTLEWLERTTLWSEDRLGEVIASLRSGTPQIILAGPPGTGKTWVARALARYLTQGDDARVETVQFHPGYSYEQFIQGLRPSVASGGGLQFRVVDGHLLNFVSRTDGAAGPRVLIIDEMNRANLPKVFGELLYLLEYRDSAVRLQYSGNYSLPPNLCIVGTMNTADRSIRGIDVALRRRFNVFECPPDTKAIADFFEGRANEVQDLAEGVDRLNRALLKKLDRHHLIGHTFFMRDPMTSATLRHVWKHQVFPLIEEYFFDQPDDLAEFELANLWPSLAGAGRAD